MHSGRAIRSMDVTPSRALIVLIIAVAVAHPADATAAVVLERVTEQAVSFEGDGCGSTSTRSPSASWGARCPCRPTLGERNAALERRRDDADRKSRRR